MNCQYCGEQIGIVRRITDRQYCSGKHRELANQNSSRHARETTSLGEMEESWLVTSGDLTRANQKSTMASVGPVILVTVALVTFLLLAPKDSTIPSNPISYVPPTAAQFGERVLGRHSGFSLRQDFSKVDLRQWTGGANWAAQGGSLVPTALRLWEPTAALSDYQMSFGAEIESKAVGWAYRATSSSNYYATKLVLVDGNRAEITRWAVVDGKASARTQLPIPVSLEQNQKYDIHVRVAGSRFTTFVDDQLVDTWTDARLAKGGVGFFAENNERARLQYVEVSEPRRGGIGGLLDFGFYLPSLPDSRRAAPFTVRLTPLN